VNAARFALRPIQRPIVEHITTHARCAVWSSMGSGKTSATIAALDALSLVEPDVWPALVVAPLRVARSTWPDEVAKWAEFAHLRVQAVVGSAAERRRALAVPADLYTTNYESLPWLVQHFGDAWPFATVVSDESTRLKGFRVRQGTQRARALGRVAHTRVRRFVELTGTPSPNGLQDLWGQAWFLDAGVRLGRSFDAFRQRWFQAIPGGDGYTQIRALPHAQGDIQAKLADLCLSVDARDWFDLREPIVSPVVVDLPPDARALYRDMEREMFIEIGETGIEAFSAAAKTMKCLQLASGAIYTDAESSRWEVVHDVKLDALESIAEEAAGAPLLVAYQFRSDLARLRQRFPAARVLDQNPQTLRDWNAGRVPMLLAHPKSAGHGLNLQDGGNILALFGHDWNLEEYQQIVERIGPVRQAQAGHDRPVFIYPIVARDTVDEVVMARRETKREVQDLLLEAMKRGQAA
jgi:SNF2 family DNA or RNA helicase